MTCKDGRFNTGNKLCSNDLRDSSDNARVFDAYVNSAEFSVTDRFGVERVTLAWAKWRVDNAIDEATGEIKAEWQTGVSNINSEETAALNNINTTTAAALDGINTLASAATSDISALRDSSLASIEEAKDNAIEEIIETGGVDIAQEPGQDINKVMSQKAVTDFVTEEIDNIEIPEVDLSNLVTKDDITNELGDSTELVASQALVSNHGLGYGQSWVDVTSQRVAGTTYTNDTGKPIFVVVVIKGLGSTEASASITVDGIEVLFGSYGRDVKGVSSLIIPDGSRYVVKYIKGSTLSVWVELR